MPRIEWKESWSVGEPRLDQEHRGLVALINRLLDAAERGAGREDLPSVWHEVLSELMAYAENHFRYEEGLMARAGYPQLDEHRAGHLGFRVEVIHRASDGKGTTPELVALHEFLAIWLEQHVLGEDRLYMPYLGFDAAGR